MEGKEEGECRGEGGRGEEKKEIKRTTFSKLVFVISIAYCVGHLALGDMHCTLKLI